VVWEISAQNVGSGLPLEGVRVLDFSRVLAGPLATMIAGDLGADVVKVEGPEGDPVRSLAPPYFGDDATYYLAVNRHRRNVVADLRDSQDFARVRALVCEADAVVENFLPSQYRALDIGALRRANPECVWVSITPASSGSDLATLPSFDVLAQARSGLMGVTGDASGAPTKVGAPLADVVTGLYGAIALVSGLYARLAGTGGRHFEAPLLECTMSSLVNQAQGYLANGVNPVRVGNDHPSIAPYGPVRTADGMIMLAVGTDAHYARLLEVLDDEEIRSHEEWSRNHQRVADRQDVRENLERVFVTRSSAQWLEALSSAGVPHAPILDVEGAFEQPAIRDGDFLGEMDSPHGPLAAMRTPLLIEGVRPPLRSGPRAFGQDTAELLGS
jgi:crotonobetainyl-CoA:carnitine CoA-transferase CaiB-like acyl-CoA transferase